VINTPNEKLMKSRFNIYFFFMVHIVIEMLVLLLLFPSTNMLPYDNNHIALAGYLTLFIFLILVYSMLILSDHNKSTRRRKFDFELDFEVESIVSYCPYCKVRKNTTTRHCMICDLCVEEFDHHCYWVNNCIGKSNYKLFVLFLLLVTSNLITNISACIIVLLAQPHSNSVLLFPPKLPFDYLYSRNTILVISSVILLICLAFMIPVLLLLAFQVGSNLNYWNKQSSLRQRDRQAAIDENKALLPNV